MFCLACTSPTTQPICPTCRTTLRTPPETTVDSLLVVAAFTHDAAARRLVHALKYRGVAAAAAPFALALAERIPASVTALVPVPRARGRAVRYGIDPAAVLASALARTTRLAVVPALRAPLWWPRHAGAGRGRRGSIRFTQHMDAPPGAALVDDVVTTGATVAAAAAALDGLPTLVLAATVAPIFTGEKAPMEVA